MTELATVTPTHSGMGTEHRAQFGRNPWVGASLSPQDPKSVKVGMPFSL